MPQPAWMAPAWAELGLRETAGSATNPRIRGFYAEVGHAGVAHDEIAWCAAYVGACLERSGLASTRSLLARSYLGWGEPLEQPRLGAVAVFSRGSDASAGHVGFWLGETADEVVVLAGNHDDRVAVAMTGKSRLLGCRWPSLPGGADRATARNFDELFEACLAHVLEMEGGYSDDPYDPGGPTNHGITLGAYAAHVGVAVTPDTFEALKARLKRVSLPVVRDIYHTRYWDPARCATLPGPVAAMHFDAAVNHGVGAAARMLQEASGAAIDGEIGPLTLAAVGASDIDALLQRYADVRRRRYRSLGHFWRFGRGWLVRVDRTLAHATALRRRLPHFPQPKKGTDTMSETTAPAPPAKWWGESMTIWGTIITTLATVLPAFGPLLGLDITAELVRQLGEQIVVVVQAVGGLIGILLTIYGRTRATTRLERREMRIQL